MPFTLPTAPNAGQSFIVDEVRYEWDGTAWITTKYLPTEPFNSIQSVLGVGHNACFFLSNGKLYSAQGNKAAYSGFIRGVSTTSNYLGPMGMCNASIVPIPESSPVVTYGVAGTTAWALLQNKNLYTWGKNSYGQLGIGSLVDSFIPVLASTSVEEVYSHRSNLGTWLYETRLLIRKSDGYVYGCGYNGRGALGLGDTVNRTSFTIIPGIGQNPLSVWNLGNYGGCTVVQKADGSIWVAGFNPTGVLGIGNTTQQNSFVNTNTSWTGGNSLIRIKDIGFAHGYHDAGGQLQDTTTFMMMLLDDGTNTFLRSCGSNNWGGLADGTTTNRTTPFTKTFGTRIKQLGYIGSVKSCFALLENGDLYAWGHNNLSFGSPLALPTNGVVTTPTLTASLVDEIISPHYITVQYNYYIPVFIRKGNALYMTGYNQYGQAGDGSSGASGGSHKFAWTPVKMPPNVQIKLVNNKALMDIWSTTGTTDIPFFIDTDNQIWAWGYNHNNGIFFENAVGEREYLVPTLVGGLGR